jgi:hypothetical protein
LLYNVVDRKNRQNQTSCNFYESTQDSFDLNWMWWHGHISYHSKTLYNFPTIYGNASFVLIKTNFAKKVANDALYIDYIYIIKVQVQDRSERHTRNIERSKSNRRRFDPGTVFISLESSLNSVQYALITDTCIESVNYNSEVEVWLWLYPQD